MKSLPRSLRSAPMAWRLALVGVCLLAIYCIEVSADVLPPRLLDPRWQFGLANALVNSCSFALVGLAAWHLAGHLAPDEERLQKQLDRLARLAAPAALGFLLLIPLQGWALWSGMNVVNASRATQVDQIIAKADRLQAAVRAASSTPDLQSRMQALQGPVLDPATLSQPLPMIKQQLLAALAQARAAANSQRRLPRLKELWSLGQQWLRAALLALVAALGLASLSRVGAEGPSLLQLFAYYRERIHSLVFNNRWLERWAEMREHRREQRLHRDRMVALRRMRRHFDELEKQETSSGLINAPGLPSLGGRPQGIRPPRDDAAYLGKLLEQAEREEQEALAHQQPEDDHPQSS